ncbi:MAG: Zn-dependent oligopeptidase [Candidatus Pacebacteria bacterium]|nr:Zn-dependent oligopeptidase [Candidatus Paceibacterota bacterium]MBP9780577.1 Zn-dependent oligopeptidase [Candidatus Paceibacterota bacterium]
MKDVQKYFSFVKWTPAQIESKAKKVLEDKKKVYEKIASLPQSKQNFESVILAIESIEAKYNDVIRPMDVLKNVSSDKKVREAAKKMIEWADKKSLQIVYSKKVYLAIKYVFEHHQPVRDADKKILDEYYASYTRMGFDLPPKEFKRVKEIKNLISKNGSNFDKRLNDWDAHLWMSLEDLEGLSEHYIDSLEKKNGKYKVTLQYPHLIPFMSQAKNAKKRKELGDLAAEKGGKENLILMEKNIALRKELASLLGYANFTDYQIERRMASSYKTVMNFENDLLEKVSLCAKNDLELLAKYKSERFKDNSSVKYFESAYLSEEYKKQHFALDSKMIREYFEMNHVVKILFSIVKKVFGISLTPVKMPVWDKDVFVLEAKVGKAVMGYIVVDLFPRQGKYGHACVAEVRDSRIENGVRVVPIMSLICNFAKPTKDSPSIISHGDVVTLFHEFGHALHAISSRQPYASLGGFQVAWDFVEVPSQFFEQWVWDKEVIGMLGQHYKTGKKIPDELVEKMLSAKNFLAGSGVVGQILFGMLDQDIHVKNIKDIVVHNSMLRKKYSGVAPSKKSLFPASFGHLMHGYESAYYSYLWSLVYAKDIFGEFKKKGIFNGQLGKEVRQKIFEQGALKKEMDLLRDFLEREPSNEAFLKELGI